MAAGCSSQRRVLPSMSVNRNVTVPAGSTFRFRYLADGGRWFDDETITPGDGRDAIIAV